MRIDVVTLFPEEVSQALGFGVVGRAMAQGRATLRCWNPRDYAEDRRGTVDDRPFGGGPGMVMKVGPLARCIEAASAADDRPVAVGALSPQGRRFDHTVARELADRDRLLLVCGRYEGIDERLISGWVDEEWSVGDYVLSGGELAAATMIDAIVRQLPGVLGAAESVVEDSFYDGLLDHPHYTRPESDACGDVPAVLLSGHHGEVANWRRRQRLWLTWLRRPDLLEAVRLDETGRRELAEQIRRYMAESEGPADRESR